MSEWSSPWPLDADGTPVRVGEDGTPDFESVDWPKVGGRWARVGTDGRPILAGRMRLPAFVVLVGVIIAGVIAFALPVHDNFGVACPGPGAVGAIGANANGYALPTPTVQSVPGFDATSVNARIQANDEAIVTSKVRACHSGGETRLIIAAVVLVVAVIGSRFVPDTAQRRPTGTDS